MIDVTEEVAKILEQSRVSIAAVQNLSRFSTYIEALQGASTAEKVTLLRGIAKSAEALASNLEFLGDLEDS